MSSFEKSYRLSDRIFFALELALEQKDVDVAEILVDALDMSMTRQAGGGDFVERRDYPAEVEKALKIMQELRAKK